MYGASADADARAARPGLAGLVLGLDLTRLRSPPHGPSISGAGTYLLLPLAFCHSFWSGLKTGLRKVRTCSLSLTLTLTLTSLTLQYRLSSFSLSASICLSVAEALPSRSGRSICDAICMNWSMAPPHTDNLTCPSDCMSVFLSVGLHGNRRFGPPKYLGTSTRPVAYYVSSPRQRRHGRQGKARQAELRRE